MRAIALGVCVVVTFAVAGAHAAIIGPTDDWMPLSEGAQEYGLSAATVQKILHAGGELVCSGTVSRDGKPRAETAFRNAWFLEDNAKVLNLNAHAVIQASGQFLPYLNHCHFQLFSDLISRDGGKQYPTDPSTADYMLGTLDPVNDLVAKDRALIPLQRAAADAVPLAVNPHAATFKVGDQLFLVSSSRFRASVSDDHAAPLIQKCHVMAQVAERDGLSGGLLTDCDTQRAVSSGLYFIRNPDDPGDLMPIAMERGVRDFVGDYQPWDREKNTDVALTLDDAFFSLDSWGGPHSPPAGGGAAAESP